MRFTTKATGRVDNHLRRLFIVALRSRTGAVRGTKSAVVGSVTDDGKDMGRGRMQTEERLSCALSVDFRQPSAPSFALQAKP
jgi:hypothetical protein